LIEQENASGEADYLLESTPTSLFNSTQQWDYPNAWAPLQAFIIQGLDYTQDKLAKQVAYRLAEKWLFTNYMGYETSKAMFEKYDVELIGKTGNGGEYEAQTGFGWTNGFAFELLNRYGKTISFNNTQELIEQENASGESDYLLESDQL
ncbi:trehalase-like, partial [Diaphorina citri]|uniref:Trehalase n=1 Tax=Diaphorina citri TaxID=121845 RepID=A0A1S3DRH0_DIACI